MTISIQKEEEGKRIGKSISMTYGGAVGSPRLSFVFEMLNEFILCEHQPLLPITCVLVDSLLLPVLGELESTPCLPWSQTGSTMCTPLLEEFSHRVHVLAQLFPICVIALSLCITFTGLPIVVAESAH